jgi:hypothetical protein
MKKKNEKKIAKAVVKQMKNYAGKVDTQLKKAEVVTFRAPHDEESSKSILSFISRIAEQPGVLIDVRDERIYFSCRDVKNIKTGQNSGYNDDRYMEIEIDEEGFCITYGHTGRHYFEDKSMLGTVMKQLEQTINQKNKSYLSDTIDKIYSESGLIRENNLDELFK